MDVYFGILFKLYKVVGGLKCVLTFPHIANVIIPIEFHIIQRGGPTTNQQMSMFVKQPEIAISQALGNLRGGLSGLNLVSFGDNEREYFVQYIIHILYMIRIIYYNTYIYIISYYICIYIYIIWIIVIYIYISITGN